MVSDGRTCIGGGLGAPRIEKTASFRQSLSGALFPFGNIAALLRNLYVR